MVLLGGCCWWCERRNNMRSRIRSEPPGGNKPVLSYISYITIFMRYYTVIAKRYRIFIWILPYIFIWISLKMRAVKLCLMFMASFAAASSSILGPGRGEWKIESPEAHGLSSAALKAAAEQIGVHANERCKLLKFCSASPSFLSLISFWL